MTVGPETYEPQSEAAALTPEECVEQLWQLRTRVLPILEATRDGYVGRVREGYPRIVDNIDQGGVFGLDLDPGFGIYFMTDGSRVYAELHRVSLRSDILSTANKEKFAGTPLQDRHDVSPTWTDLQFRNLVSRLLSYWNGQQTVIYRVDS